MRTLSIVGIIMGLFTAGMSIWRWGGGLYDVPFKMWIGIVVAIAIMAGAYLIDWMTLRDKITSNQNQKIDSMQQEIKGLKEMNNLK